MQTTQIMMGSPFKDLKYDVLTTYCNKYKDAQGETHYSTEEFSVGNDGIFSFEDALEEAYRLTVKGDWEYISTLTDGRNNVTKRMEACLRELEGFAARVQSYGASLDGITAIELPEYLDQVIEKSIRNGGA